MRDLRTGNRDGRDTLLNVETLRFSDGDVQTAPFLNHAPTDITLTGGRVLENSLAGTLVATATGVDPDRSEGFRYSLRTLEGLPYDGPFTIDEATGAIRVATNSTLDYESQKTYSLVIRVEDRAGLYHDKIINLVVDNVSGNQTATISSGVLTGLQEEDQLTGTGGAETLTGLGGNDTLLGGAGADVLDGGDGDDWLDGGLGADLMIGGAGNNVFVVDNVGDRIDLSAGGGRNTVRTALAAYSLADGLANLVFTGRLASIGTGNDRANAITGGSADDTLVGLGGDDVLIGGLGRDSLDGGDGADILNGGAGADVMRGGRGADKFYIDDIGDIVVDATAEDLVIVSVANYDLSALRAAGARIAFNIKLAAAQYSLSGGDEADTLTGSDNSANYIGGKGDDTYNVAGGVIIEQAGEGIDTVQTSAGRYVLGANLENLVYTGSGAFQGIGNALANRLTGSSGDDQLSGDAGADTLSGGAGADTLLGGADADYLDGGSGADSMLGGMGADIFVIDNLDDVTDATAGDIVILGVRNYDLAKLDGASIRYQLTSTSGGQRLTGASGNDTLDGGLDADTLSGGGGNDIYLVDNAGDVVVERAGEGVDTVRTTLASYSLGDNVENLSFLGSGAFTGQGNGLANLMTGGSGVDQLFGFAGSDTLQGGSGNDELWGGRGSDHLWGGAGNDVFIFRADDAVGGLAGDRDWVRDFDSRRPHRPFAHSP